MSRTVTHSSNSRRFAPVPLTAGLVMILMSAAAFAHRLDASFGIATTLGCALLLIGVVWTVAAVHRARSNRASSLGATPD